MSNHVKTLLEDAAADPLHEIDMTRARREAGRLRWIERSSVLGLVALLLLGGLAVSSTGLLNSSNDESVSAPNANTGVSGARITGTFPVPGNPQSIDVGHDSVWIAVARGDGSAALIQMDKSDGDVISELAIDGSIEQLAAEEDAVWITVISDNGVIATHRVDPISNEISHTVERVGGEVEIVEGHAWAIEQYSRSGPDSNAPYSLVELDDNGGVMKTVEINAPPLDLAAGGGSLWVLTSTQSGDVVGPRGVVEIDPEAGTVTREIDIDGHNVRIVADGEFLWIPGWLHDFAEVSASADEPVIARVSLESGELSKEPIPIGSSFRPFDSDVDGVWFLGDSEESGDVCHIDRLTLLVDLCVDPGGLAEALFDPARFDPASDSIWVSGQGQKVVRIAIERD